MTEKRHNRSTPEQREMKALRAVWQRMSGFDEPAQRRMIHWLVMKVEEQVAKRARAEPLC